MVNSCARVLIALSIAAAGCASAGNTAKRHVIYVHGKSVEDTGSRRPDTRYGVYEYDAILDAFRKQGFIVTSEQRPLNADPHVYAQRIVDEVRALMRDGVPPSHITVVGASKGGVITMLASTTLQEPEVRYVLLGNCNDSILRDFAPRLSGRVLSVFESVDEFGGTCEKFFKAGGKLTSHAEERLDLGIGHAFLYTPRAEWLEPAVKFIQSTQ